VDGFFLSSTCQLHPSYLLCIHAQWPTLPLQLAQALSTGLEDLGITAPSVPSSKPLPAAPTSAPVMTDEERELAELEASMAM